MAPSLAAGARPVVSSKWLQMSERAVALIQEAAAGRFVSLGVDRGDAVGVVEKPKFLEVMRLLKETHALSYDLLLSVTAVDWFDTVRRGAQFGDATSKDEAATRYEVVYHLLSTNNLFRFRVKCPLDESDASIPSITEIWPGANFMERECWDMLGINFIGHPDQRRILMYDEFVGHPLRKDYPVQGKQPRVPLRFPEVRNTAVDMQRPVLVGINSRVRTQRENERRTNGEKSPSA